MTVSAGDALFEHGRIPGQVEVDDKRGSLQVEADAARHQADEEQRALARLKRRHLGVAVPGRGAAVEVLVGDLLLVQPLPEQRQVPHAVARRLEVA